MRDTLTTVGLAALASLVLFVLYPFVILPFAQRTIEQEEQAS